MQQRLNDRVRKSKSYCTNLNDHVKNLNDFVKYQNDHATNCILITCRNTSYCSIFYRITWPKCRKGVLKHHDYVEKA